MALSKAARAKIPSSKFALPDERKYPIDTRKRAGKALGLVALNGTPAQKAKVRAAVKKAHPAMGDPGMKPPAKTGAKKTAVKAKTPVKSAPMRRSGGRGK